MNFFTQGRTGTVTFAMVTTLCLSYTGIYILPAKPENTGMKEVIYGR